MNRIVLGNRGGDYGLWISKPSLDASSTNDEDFLVSPSRTLNQPFLTGAIILAAGQPGSTKVVHNLGYIPCVQVFGANVLVDTTAIHVNGKDDNSYYQNLQGGGYTGYSSVNCYYYIFKTKAAAS